MDVENNLMAGLIIPGREKGRGKLGDWVRHTTIYKTDN